MKTAVIYARYSCDAQTEQSIEGQLRVCNEFAAQNGIIIVDKYIDRATTGTNDNRAAFQKMLADADNKPVWDIVLVYALDRFGRNSIEIALNKQRLSKNNIILISATQRTSVNIDGSKNLDGILLENVLIGLSEYYSVELSQKVRRGQRESRRKGNFLGGRPPYGYRVENKKILIHEERAEVVRLIFDLYVSGKCVREILEELNKRGILYNSKPIYQSTLFNILKLEKYTGVYRYDGEVYMDMYPQIVDTAVFQRVQRMMDKNKHGSSSRNTDFLLKGKLFCGRCGMKINGDSGTAKSGEMKFYYTCSNKKRFRGCSKTSLKKEALEKCVIDATLKLLNTPEKISRLADEVVKLNEQISKEQSILNLLISERAKIQKSLDNVMIAIEEGIITSTTKARMTELENSLAEINMKIAAEESKLDRTLKKEDVEKFIIEALASEPKAMIELLIDKIILYEDRIEIFYIYGNNTDPDEPNLEVHRDFFLSSQKIKITQRGFEATFELKL
ncbi:MAG: recombinase family protein [Clostridia bacterium]|nr:recombinase family protein [Clostridia bacterium]